MSRQRVDILGVPFLNTTQQEFVHLLHKHVKQQEKAFVVTANPEIVMKTLEDSDFKKIVQQATYVTADGIGVVKAAQLLNKPLPERVTGYDTMIELLKLSNENQYSIYLLGATQETLEKAEKKIKKTYPNVVIAGSHNGFFDWSKTDIQEEIKKTEPDFVFVALGVPRQEKWIASNYHLFNKGIFIGVGGSFDVIAGTVERAPKAWQKANLEWLYRLIKQPSRWKRMLALPKFALKILKEKVKG
jgi:N-acetylglucosaminyldiphosphoundecaprenol N-acetyl-beta-D-mannosaminyltransferase